MKLRPRTALGAVVVTAAAVVTVPLTTHAETPAGPDSLIETVSPARSVMGLHDSAGHSMDTLKVVSDPTTPGRFLGVYHWSTSGTFDVGVATCYRPADLDLPEDGRHLGVPAGPGVLPAPKNGPILVDEESTTSHLRFKYWTSVSAFLGTTGAYKTYDAPKTLSNCAEGTPDIRSVKYASSTSTITSGSTITVGHHYSANCDTDRQAVGTLTDFGNWKTAAAPATDDAPSPRAPPASTETGTCSPTVVTTGRSSKAASTPTRRRSRWPTGAPSSTTARPLDGWTCARPGGRPRSRIRRPPSPRSVGCPR